MGFCKIFKLCVAPTIEIKIFHRNKKSFTNIQQLNSIQYSVQGQNDPGEQCGPYGPFVSEALLIVLTNFFSPERAIYIVFCINCVDDLSIVKVYDCMYKTSYSDVTHVVQRHAESNLNWRWELRGWLKSQVNRKKKTSIWKFFR